MRRYRTSSKRLIILLFFSLLISILFAFGKTNAWKVFFGVEAIFIAMAFASFTYIEIYFEGENIVQASFFFSRRKQPLSSIRRVRFEADIDSFGGRTTCTTIDFNDAKPFMLYDFSKADLKEIVNKISFSAPDIIHSSIREYLNNGAKQQKSVFRASDKFIFIAGAAFILIAALWWLISK